MKLPHTRIMRASIRYNKLLILSSGAAIRGILMISISRNNRSVSKSEGSVALAKAASGVKLNSPNCFPHGFKR